MAATVVLSCSSSTKKLNRLFQTHQKFDTVIITALLTHQRDGSRS
ncbi:unnamed protein product [Brassica rapa]|uniref:Uncharacterized protein n=2 Tax=Brassica TaxID=3705 RepID=A0A8D9HP25_BRACM|nr:unnamed protein product [Brassica napus]CAG7903165.1 unnamed protein product [Brassica rapa]